MEDISCMALSEEGRKHPSEQGSDEEASGDLASRNPVLTPDFDRKFFHHACAIIQRSVIEKPFQQPHLPGPFLPDRRCRFAVALSLMLSSESNGHNEIVLSCDFNLSSSPSVFTMFWAKDKEASEAEIKRAEELCQIIRDYAKRPESRREFFPTTFGFLIKHQKSKWIKYAEKLFSLTERISPAFQSVMLTTSRELHETNIPATPRLCEDPYIRGLCIDRMVTPAQAVCLCVDTIRRVSRQIKSSGDMEPEQLFELSTMAYILAASELYRKFGELCPQMTDYEDCISLSELARAVGGYYSGLSLVPHYCKTEESIGDLTRGDLAQLTPCLVGALSEDKLQSLAKKYNLHIQDRQSPSSHDISDFYDLIRLRHAKLQGEGHAFPPLGERELWLRAFPRLADLNFQQHLPPPCTHPEVTLGLNLLSNGVPKDMFITGPVKPCFFCQIVFKGARGYKHFQIPPDDETISPGWGYTGIEEFDKVVEESVWRRLDDLLWLIY